MPRNSSGTYSLPVAAYVAGTTIRSTDMNTNLSDIGTALTQSLATTGVSSMTGVLKLAAGAANAPSLTLASDTTTGWYNSAVGAWTFVSAGSAVLALSSALAAVTGALTTTTSITIGTTLAVTGATTLTGALTVNNSISSVKAAEPNLVLQNTTNTSADLIGITFLRGSGAGNAFTINTLGGASNDVTTARLKIGSTTVIDYTATTISPKKSISLDAGIIIVTTAGYTDYTEIAAPSAPAANTARFYTLDLSGTTFLAYKDSAGLERPIAGPGSVVTYGYDEYTASTVLTTVMPEDNTIPQITEGTEILSVTVTLKYADSRVRCRFAGFAGSGTAGSNITWAIFRTGNSNALNVGVMDHARSGAADTLNHPMPICLEVEEASPGTGSQTYSVRIGPTSTACMVNGTGSTALYGGAARATLIVEEILAS